MPRPFMIDWNEWFMMHAFKRPMPGSKWIYVLIFDSCHWFKVNFVQFDLALFGFCMNLRKVLNIMHFSSSSKKSSKITLSFVDYQNITFFCPKLWKWPLCGYMWNLGLRILLFQVFALNFDFSPEKPVAKPNFIEMCYFLMSRALKFVIKHNYNDIFEDKIVSGLYMIV